jgi:septal ring factor EnvC (AmiA/AmiB activator)
LEKAKADIAAQVQQHEVLTKENSELKGITPNLITCIAKCQEATAALKKQESDSLERGIIILCS